MEVENEQNSARKNSGSSIFRASDHADRPCTQHDDHADAGRHACPVSCRRRAADRRHGVLFAWHGCIHDTDGRGYRRTAAAHEKSADLDGRSRRRSVLRARTAAHNLQNTAFSFAHSILYCSFHLFRLCAERICIGCIRFGRCYDRLDHGSVHHGARRWSRFDTRRQRRTG